MAYNQSAPKKVYMSLTMHILQSPQWVQFRRRTPSVKKVLGSEGSFVYVHRIPHSPLTVAYMPRPVSFGNIEGVKAACKKERAVFLKIEPALENSGLGVGNSEYRPGDPVLPRHTIYVNLSRPEGELLEAMHEKTRYNIRLAQKKKIRITEGENLEGFVELLGKTETRQGFYSHPPGYYKTLWETLRPFEMVYLLSAHPPDAPDAFAAAVMLLRYRDFLYYAYGGSDPKYREFMAPHLLHWEAIKLGKRLGCKTYDLWGSYRNSPDESDPWWGIYRFKSGFGGQEVTFPLAADIPLSPLYSLYPLLDRLRGLTR